LQYAPPKKPMKLAPIVMIQADQYRRPPRQACSTATPIVPASQKTTDERRVQGFFHCAIRAAHHQTVYLLTAGSARVRLGLLTTKRCIFSRPAAPVEPYHAEHPDGTAGRLSLGRHHPRCLLADGGRAQRCSMRCRPPLLIATSASNSQQRRPRSPPASLP